jgi:large subunit ribosomal protein L34e
MVAGKFKSSRFRKVFVRTPGNKTVVQYRKKKPKIAHCPETGQPLLGIPRLFPSKIGGVAKSKRCPSRPFGGNLSSKAMRKLIKQRVIKSNNE